MKLKILILAVGFTLVLAISAGATPTLGVIDTDTLATSGGTTPVGMDGFMFPADGEITVWWGFNSPNSWTDSARNAHVWILTNAGSINTFTVTADISTYVFELKVPVDGKIDGYDGPYYAADLGSIADLGTLWKEATEEVAPDLTSGNKSFYLLEGFLGGPLSLGDWIFAVADINPTGTSVNPGLVFNNGDDYFSRKTTSSVVVPEPTTFLLLGSGLLGIGLLKRRISKKG